MWPSFRVQKNHQANEQSFLYQHACQSIDAGDTKQALAALNKMQRKNPNDPRYMYGLGKLYTQQQQRCLAYHWYLKAAEKQHADAFYALGKIEFERQNLHLAQHYLQQAAQLNSALPYLLLGKIHQQRFDYQKAIKILQISVSYKQFEALLILGDIYLRLKDFKNAKKCFSDAFQYEVPHSAHALAQYYQILHHYDEAKSWYIYSFQVDNNLTSLEHLGLVFCAENQIIYGETLIQLADKLYEQQKLTPHEQAILTQIRGEYVPSERL